TGLLRVRREGQQAPPRNLSARDSNWHKWARTKCAESCRMSLRTSFLSLTGAALALLMTASAHAETAPAPYDAGFTGKCWSTTIVPRTDGLLVPSNTPALAFQPTVTDGSRTTTVESLALYTASGDLVDGSVGAD